MLPEYYADYAKEHPGEHARADVIVVDPPRKGCERSVLDTMVQMEPERIVYVSCDSATLARDVKYLRENGYEIRKVKATDMFPMSVHVEVVLLSTSGEFVEVLNFREDNEESSEETTGCKASVYAEFDECTRSENFIEILQIQAIARYMSFTPTGKQGKKKQIMNGIEVSVVLHLV